MKTTSLRNLFFLITYLFFFHSLVSEPHPAESFESFLKTNLPITQVNSRFDSQTVDEEEEIDSEIEYFSKKCKHPSLVAYGLILTHFSKVDGLLFLKECPKEKDNKTKQLEERAKQQIFMLFKFPKLEIISDSVDPDSKEITDNWEKRVYVFSNFYHKNILQWLGEEKELTNQINRIIYTDMNEKRKENLLKKIKEDLILSNKRIYHLFQYSTHNPFLVESLGEENKISHSKLGSLIGLISKEEYLKEIQKVRIKKLGDCLDSLDIQNSKVRLFSLYGFWQDYSFFFDYDQTKETKDSLSVRKFLKKSLLNSHHFESRLEKGLNTCEALAEFHRKDE